MVFENRKARIWRGRDRIIGAFSEIFVCESWPEQLSSQRSLVFSPLRAIRGIFSTCNAFAKEVFRHDPMFRHRSATPAGVTGNDEVRSPGDNVTSIERSAVGARADTATASIAAVGGQPSGTGQPRGSADKGRKQKQAQEAVRLGPKGKGPSTVGAISPVADDAPPAERHDLTPE